MSKYITLIKERYNNSKNAKIGDKCICPSCLTAFTKENYQQAFCKTKIKTQCKDYYWNKIRTDNWLNKTEKSLNSVSLNDYNDYDIQDIF